MLEQLIDPAAELEVLAGGFGFIEGPLWHDDGFLLFSDIPGDTIHRWDADSGVSVFRNPSGKANGLAWDRSGCLLACEHVRSVISRTAADGSVEVLISHWQGNELNSPNDVTVARDGTIWFTDPHPAGRIEAWGKEREAELDFCGVFGFDPESGELTLVSDRIRFPNGICISPDGSVLYANDSLEMTITAFQLGDGIAVRGESLFFRQGAGGRLTSAGIAPLDPDAPVGVPDGMKCDERGNVWCTGPGGVWVISPEGERLGIVETPEFAANLGWGGPSGTTLFITASSQLLRLETLVRGAN